MGINISNTRVIVHTRLVLVIREVHETITMAYAQSLSGNDVYLFPNISSHMEQLGARYRCGANESHASDSQKTTTYLSALSNAYSHSDVVATRTDGQLGCRAHRSHDECMDHSPDSTIEATSDAKYSGRPQSPAKQSASTHMNRRTKNRVCI